MINYIDEIVNDSLPIWDECMNTEFVQGLIKGKLTEEQITKYIVEDTKYLLNYAKCYAYLITKCNTLEEIRMYYDILSFVKEGETSVRREFLHSHGLTDEDVETSLPDSITQMYVDSMVSWCSTGTIVEGTMSVLPCMLSYEYIFLKLYKEYPNMLEGNPYRSILAEYVAEGMDKVCEAWKNFANELMNKYPFNMEKCKAIFRTSSLREKDFWIMSYNNKLEFIK